MHELRFVVEHAGCPSCAERLRTFLGEAGSVEAVEIDEAADTAAVRIVAAAPVSVDAVDRALEAASEGSGHTYARRP